MLENLTTLDRLALVTKYPFLLLDNGLPYDDYCWADFIPYGWWKAFGEKLCEDIAEAIEKDGIKATFSIYEIKEKYGMLEIYCDFSDSVWDVVRKYELLSKDTCINCGKEATVKKKNGWIVPLCDDCFKGALE